MSATSEYDALLFRSVKGGLANRLRALVGYQALSRLRGWRFGLSWVPASACEAEFAELFEPAEVTLVTAEEASRLEASSGTLTCTAADWFHDIWKRHASDIPWMEFLGEVRVWLDRLRPAASIQEAVAAFVDQHRLAAACGVHIRHTDNLDVFAGRATDGNFDAERFSTLEGFLDTIRSHIVSGPVFLATDNVGVERMCRDEFGGAIITYPKRYTLAWDREAHAGAYARGAQLRTTAIADALIEMVLLSSCRQIVGTYFSSFSKFAAVWGRTGYLEIAGRTAVPHPVIETTLAEFRALQ